MWCLHMWKLVWWFITKLTKKLSNDPVIPILEIYPKEIKTLKKKKP